MKKKIDTAYKTIGEVAHELQLLDKRSGNLKTHTIRFWETQFKQLKPTIRAGKRRYYSPKDLKILKTIMYMLKNRGLTIKGVKKILDNSDLNSLDDNVGFDVNNFTKTTNLKERLMKINKLVKNLKN